MDDKLYGLITEALRLLLPLLLAVVPIATAVITRALLRYLQRLDGKAAQEMGANKWAWLKDVTLVAIRAADQYRVTAGWDNERAKRAVVKEVHKAAKTAGIPLDAMMTDTLIEGLLRGIREQQQMIGVTSTPNTTAINPLSEP